MAKKNTAEKRSAGYSEQAHTEFLLVGLLLIAIIIVLSFQFNSVGIESRIKQKLAGKELAYYDIRGMRVTEIVESGDVKSIKFEKCISDNEMCYVAMIETPLPWKVYYDKNTLEEVGIQQLFVS